MHQLPECEGPNKGMAYVADPNGQSFRPAIDVRLDLGALAADIADVQGHIKEAFYANLFLMMAEFRPPRDPASRAKSTNGARGASALFLGPVLGHGSWLAPPVDLGLITRRALP